MNPYSVLSFIAFLLYLQAGAIILYRSPRRPVNIVFSLLCLAFSIFAFFSAFIYSASIAEQAYLYDRLASIGWTTFPVLMVLFFVKISKNKSLFIKNTIKFILLPLVIASLIVIFIDLESSKFYYQYGQTWHFELNKNSIWVYLFVFYLFFSVALSLYVLVNWYLYTRTNREKKQAVIIMFSLLLFFVTSTFTNIFFTFLNIAIVPALAPVNSILWIAGVFYAMIKHQRDVISADIVSDLIIKRMNEFLLFFDNNYKILAANQYTLNNLSYSYNEIAGLSFKKIFTNNKLIEELFLKIKKSIASPQIRVNLLSVTGKQIPVMLSGLTIKDKYKNLLGYVLIGMDDRQKIQLKKEMAERVHNEKMLNKTKKDLESVVKQNTMELSEANKKLQIEILERKRAEDQIKYDLAEKTKLLSEVHHRGKNNFQIIISLINMLSFHKDMGSESAEKLNQIAGRVRMISAVHEEFYSSENISEIDFSEFLKNRAKDLNITLNQGKKITFRFNLSEKFLEIDKAIPCGIIYHELLANAIKFAFADNNSDMNKKVKKDNIIKI